MSWKPIKDSFFAVQLNSWLVSISKFCFRLRLFSPLIGERLSRPSVLWVPVIYGYLFSDNFSFLLSWNACFEISNPQCTQQNVGIENDSPPAALGALFLFWSLLNADPVLRASKRLSMTPSWSSGALKSTRARFFSALSALSRSCFSRASLARACLACASRSLMILL